MGASLFCSIDNKSALNLKQFSNKYVVEHRETYLLLGDRGQRMQKGGHLEDVAGDFAVLEERIVPSKVSHSRNIAATCGQSANQKSFCQGARNL
jgi:hypothetical protein